MRTSRATLGVCLGALAAAVHGGCAHAPGSGDARETIWSGTVVVRDDVLIGPGERLAIRPGTRVVFAFRDDDGDGAGDARIVVRGAVSAVGTPGAPIVFAPERAGAAPGWREVLIERAESARFAECRFAGAQQALHVHRTPLAVEACRFEGNAIGVRFRGDPVSVRRSRFAGNGTALRYWESSPRVEACEFAGNGTAVFVREGSARSVLRGNDFLSSADYHVKLGEAQADDVDAAGNWWGGDRRDRIESLIFDREDAAYLGRVRYEPAAAAPTAAAGERR